ncbi:gamma-glutamylcyclotransferase [candidate division KSB1 bacterium]|nr:gamma-glutamylcyclotransferase [candidate division KSB1 bacterium]
MAKRKVQTFFYGSYMNFAVLKEMGIIPERWEVVKLSGYAIRIEPRANLVPSEQHCVYGIITTATHEELARLYAHAKEVLGETYLPEAVLVETLDGKWLPALCYICHDMKLRPPANDYVDRIVKPARELGFPEWYIERIESFRSVA